MLEKEGPGWRFANDPSKEFFSVLIGGSNWAFELSESEWTLLMSLIIELIEQHKKLANQLMDEESLCIEKELNQWWGCLDGDRSSWSLQVILKSKDELGRGVEGHWPKPAAQEITSVMRKMWDSNQ